MSRSAATSTVTSMPILNETMKAKNPQTELPTTALSTRQEILIFSFQFLIRDN
jgi:hypothetical protein